MASHYFHVEAYALTGRLNLPFEEQIKKQAFVKLEGDSTKLLLEEEGLRKLKGKKAQENYLSQHVKNYRLENIISYSAAHTQVSVHRSRNNPNAFVTLATSSVENLNVLNVITADKVVAQISTTHLPDQYSPEVTFLGTHFENLRIASHKTEPFVNLGFAGKAPPGENDYYPTEATKKDGLMASVEKQFQKLRHEFANIKVGLEPEYIQHLSEKDSWYTKQYHHFSDFDYKHLQDRAAEAAAPNRPKWDGVTCSLVEHVDIENIEVPVKDAKPIVIPPPARSFGHVIHVPDFGTIFLAELKVSHNSFHLTMIRLELGCIADGSASIATCKVNGKRSGGGNGGGLAGNADTDDLKEIEAASMAAPSAPGERRGARAQPLVEEAVQLGSVPPGRPGQEPKQQEVLRRTPHMDLSLDAALEPGTPFDVYVSVDTKLAKPGEESEEVILKGPPSQEEFPVYVTLIVSGHFELLGDSVELMTILRNGESAPVVFKVRCREILPAEQNAALSALFTYEGHPSGRVTRRFRVENGKLIPPIDEGGKQPDTLGPKLAASTGLDAYDLTISVLDAGENDGRHFRLIVDAPAIGKRLERTWNLGTCTEQIVSNYMKGFVADNLKPTTRLAQLTGVGVDLFRATPEDFQKLFWEMVDAGKPPNTILVVSDDPYIPWELMVPRRTVPGNVPETRKPLGVEFSVGRWIRGDYTSPPQQIPLDRTCVIAPNYIMAAKNLKWAPEESKFVCESFQPSMAIDPADLDKISEALRDRGATLLHFICHGAAGTGAQQTLYLRDMVNNLSCAVVEGSDGFVTAIFRDHTFVFLNACEVGRTAPALVGINGLPVTFLRLGASGVVAALWSVKDDLAHQVAETFYKAVLKQPQTPFAEILRDIRSRAYSGVAEDTYAAYCFYGSPLAKRKL